MILLTLKRYKNYFALFRTIFIAYFLERFINNWFNFITLKKNERFYLIILNWNDW